jgi:hypothetical protein
MAERGRARIGSTAATTSKALGQFGYRDREFGFRLGHGSMSEVFRTAVDRTYEGYTGPNGQIRERIIRRELCWTLRRQYIVTATSLPAIKTPRRSKPVDRSAHMHAEVARSSVMVSLSVQFLQWHWNQVCRSAWLRLFVSVKYFEYLFEIWAFLLWRSKWSTLEEAMDLSQDRLILELEHVHQTKVYCVLL